MRALFQQRGDAKPIEHAIWRGLGALMLAHLAAIAVHKTALGTPEDVWWMCHVMLGIGGAGFVLRSPALLATALTATLIPQLFWLVDCCIGLLTGTFPLNLTNHVANLSTLEWILTSFHFYMLPVLFAGVIRFGRFPASTVPLTLTLYAVLTIVGRLLPAGANVNSAHHIWTHVDLALFHWVNALPAAGYLIALNLWMALVIFLPASIIIRGFVIDAPRLVMAPPRTTGRDSRRTLKRHGRVVGRFG